jgi:hypothetical protein
MTKIIVVTLLAIGVVILLIQIFPWVVTLLALIGALRVIRLLEGPKDH